jgi:hypothetical protein
VSLNVALKLWSLTLTKITSVTHMRERESASLGRRQEYPTHKGSVDIPIERKRDVLN